MAIEQKWLAVPPKLFTADGGEFGQVTIANTSGFKVKQKVVLQASLLPQLELQVKRVVSKTSLIVGPLPGTTPNGLNKKQDIRAYTVAAGAFIYAGEQEKSKLKPDDILQAVYEQEPTVANRVLAVDEFGNPIGESNPLPVAFDGTIAVGSVQVEGTNSNVIEPNVDGSINVNVISSPVSGHTVKCKFNEIIAVPSGSETQIVSYTVPAATTAILQRISTSGDNVARYNVYLNGTPFDTQRTMFGGDFNALFEFIMGTNEGFILNTGDVISVKVLHSRPSVGDFNARVQILEIT